MTAQLNLHACCGFRLAGTPYKTTSAHGRYCTVINLQFQQTVVAVVGRSGRGKSTVAALACRPRSIMG
jgi:ABC-type multidrug transport system fused ATPase/permease subunit